MRDAAPRDGIFAEGVTVTYRNGLTALTDTGFQIPQGTITALVRPSRTNLARRHAATGDHRRNLRRDPAGALERPDGHLLRRGPCPHHWPQARPAQARLLHPPLRLDRRRHADRRGLPRRRHGGDPRRHRLSADRPLPAPIGAVSGFVGAYLSYFLDGATGGIIVLLQTALFALAFIFAPKHGLLAAKARARQA